MGGNALKDFGVVRLERADFLVAQAEMSKHLREMYPRINFEHILAYRDKDSFGDMDIIYNLKDETYNFIDDYLKRSAPKAHVKNGDVLSVTLQTPKGLFQVDFIKVQKDTFNFSYHYFNFNDLGNFLGRIYHKAGFKLGHDGLKYVVRAPGNDVRVLKEITVTKFWYDAMVFMGYQRYFQRGFNRVEDLFEFTLSSPYANRNIYLLENRNHTARVRDRKRKNYTKLLAFLENPETQCVDFDWSEKDALREEFLLKAFDRWPSFKREHDKAIEELHQAELFRAKFNGDIVKELTGLEGKALGVFIKELRTFFGDRLNEMVMTSTEEEISMTIRGFFAIFNPNRVK